MRISALPEPVRRMLFMGVIVVGIIALIGVGRTWLPALLHPTPQSTAPPVGRNEKVSPLLFGANLDFSASKHITLPSPARSRQLQRIHIQIVRISFPANSSSADLLKIAQYVKSLNATPLICLHGPLYSNALADNILAVQTMSSVFGRAVVYYEYGDEDDAAGLSAEQYTAAWNANIPQFEEISPYAQFVGPDTYRYDSTYLQTFLQKARPAPDAVSWHEYSCYGTWSQQRCMQGIGEWGKHIASARDLMERLSGASLPIMITEWDYAANARSDDGKSNDSAFLAAWTKAALETLAENQVYASIHYAGINASTPLIDPDDQHLAPQGQVMQTLYEQFFGKGKT